MGLFRRFFGGRDKEVDIDARDAEIAQPNETYLLSVREENAALADDPLAFSRWIFQGLVEIMTDEKANSLCAPEEVAFRLGITKDEQRAAANEFVLMQALGTCMFTGLNFPLDYHQKFKREMAIQVSKRIFGGHIEERIAEIDSAIESYLIDLIDLTAREHVFNRFSEKYFERVYPNNPNSLAMELRASIAQIPLDLAIDAFKLTEDAYCKLKHGLDYKTIVAVEKLFGKNRAGY